MKLLVAIINIYDAHNVIRSLSQEGFQITKLATTGGFLMAGNVTIITGIEDRRVDEAIDIIRAKSESRSQTVPAIAESHLNGFFDIPVVDITVGGATVFVIPVDRFEKL